MPRLNSRLIASTGYLTTWFDDTRTIGTDGMLTIKLSDGTVIAGPLWIIYTYGGAGHWAAEIKGGVLFDGTMLPDAALGPYCDPVGPDGSLVVKRVRNSYGPWGFVGGADFGGDCRTVTNYGNGQAGWIEGSWIFHTNFPCRWAGTPCYNYRLKGDDFLCQSALTGQLVLNDRVIRPSGNYFRPDFAFDGTNYHVVYSTVEGEPTVSTLVISAAALASYPTFTVFPTPAPVATFDRPLWFGYYYSFSDRYGDNLTAPGNCAVVVEPTVVSRCPKKLIIAPNCIDAAAARWQDVAAVYVSFGDTTNLVGAISAAKLAMDQKGLSPRPVLALIDGWPPAALPSADWVGLECYCAPTESVDDFHARIVTGLARMPNVPLVLIGQAYDRNGAETDLAKVARIQDFWPALARDSRVIGVLLFSDGRPGGTRTHEEWRPWHTAFVGAVRTPAIDLPRPTPNPSPHVQGDVLMQLSSFDSSKGVIAYKALKQSSQSGCTNVILPNDRVFSCQDGGASGDRDPGADGPWEQGQVSGSTVTYCVNGKYHTFGLVPVDKLPA